MRVGTRVQRAAGVVAVVAAAWLIDSQFFLEARLRGAAAAHWDWLRGQPELKLYGLQLRGGEQYAALLQARSGVRSHTVGGCYIWPPRRQAYIDAYNEVTVSRLRHFHGHDVFVEVEAEVQRMASAGR